MKVLITGSSGVGKSTVVHELQKRGYRAIDGDEEPGLAQLVVAATGKPAEWPEGYIDWSYYHWDLQLPKLKDVLARDTTVFIGGVYSNQRDFHHLFDKIYVLVVPPEEHLRRNLVRPTRQAGDDEQNIMQRVERAEIIKQRLIDSGAELVDASGTVDEIADIILERMKDEC